MPIKGILGGNGVKPLGYGLGAGEAVVETDPEFNETVLLLHADGSEGAGDTAALGDPNYKAFKDNSTSAHAITVNGDTYGNDFSPYYYADGYWSNSFTADSLKVTTAADFDLSSNQEFSIEFWLHPTAINASWGIFFYANPNDDNFQISHDASGNVDLRFAGSAIGTPFNLPLNTWSHLVITRDSSGYIRQFLDGVLKNYNQKTDAINRDFVTIGNRNGGNHFLGYISNVRWVKDSIPTTYQTSETSTGTTVFTSPTAPVTTSSQGATSADVKLLTCQSNRFKDTSDNQTFTVNGTPKVSTNTPFTVTKTANVGSGFFDGNGDGLTTATSSDFAFGTNNFTFECWVYPFSKAGTQVILDLRDANNGDQDHMSALVWLGSQLDCYSGANFSSGTDLGNYFFANSWNHVAVQRSGNTLYHSVNGIVSSTNPSFTRDLTANGLATIGGNVGLGVSMFTGYIADMRVVNGTAVYGTSNFSVPTSPLTAVTNTKLLTCQYSGAVRNVGFVDDSKYNHRVTRLGDATIGTFSPFSLEDGYWGRYSNSITNSDTHGSGITLGTNNFTIGMFVYPIGRNNAIGGALDTGGNSRTTLYADTGAASVIIAHDQLLVAAPSTWSIQIDFTTDIALNQWQWIQVDRTGSTFRVSIDGSYVDGGGATASGSVPAINTGTFGERAGQDDYMGYFSNFILINGANRGSITPPTTPLTADSNTALLLYQNNRLVNNGNTSVTLTSGGDNKIVPFSPIAPSRAYTKNAVGGSLYNDGNDSVKLTTATRALRTSEFEIEFWYYPTTSSGSKYLFGGDWHPTLIYMGSGSTEVRLYSSSSGSSWNVFSGNSLGNANINQWNHFYLSRKSNALYAFINGVASASNGTSWTTNYTLTPVLYIGAYDDVGSGAATGYMSNVKYNIGSGSTTKSVPTAPTTPDSDTYVQLNFDNAGIIDHTMRNNLETEGNVRISTIQKKVGTGSIYFDGDGDYLTGTNQPYLTIGTGSYTFECWVYITTGVQTYHGLLSIVGGIQFQLSDERMRLSSAGAPVMIADVADAISLNTWTHLAFVRDASASNALKFFKDGTLIKSGTDSTNWNHTGALQVGRVFNSSIYDIEGYLDDVRLTLEPRYSSDFTPPTKAFPDR